MSLIRTLFNFNLKTQLLPILPNHILTRLLHHGLDCMYRLICQLNRTAKQQRVMYVKYELISLIQPCAFKLMHNQFLVAERNVCREVRNTSLPILYARIFFCKSCTAEYSKTT